MLGLTIGQYSQLLYQHLQASAKIRKEKPSPGNYVTLNLHLSTFNENNSPWVLAPKIRCSHAQTDAQTDAERSGLSTVIDEASNPNLSQRQNKHQARYNSHQVQKNYTRLLVLEVL